MRETSQNHGVSCSHFRYEEAGENSYNFAVGLIFIKPTAKFSGLTSLLCSVDPLTRLFLAPLANRLTLLVYMQG